MKIVFQAIMVFLLVARMALVMMLTLGPLYLSKALRKRRSFEKKNSIDISARSFARDDLKAFIAFEVSSEGELEQVRPLLNYYLKNGKRIELIFASESVENKCQKLYCDYPKQLRIYRLPLLSFSTTVASWITAPHLVLCRYDFYPQLLLYGLKRGCRLTVVSATLKGKKTTGGFGKWFYKNLYKSFDKIVAASVNDQVAFFELIGIKPDVFDFRIIQIVERLNNFAEKWRTLPLGQVFEEIVFNYEKERRIIMGSCWPEEMVAFNDDDFCKEITAGNLFVVLAPHKLNSKFLLQLKEAFTKAVGGRIPLYHITSEMKSEDIRELLIQHGKQKGVWIVTVPGILCEFYTLFGYAYVGGGFGRSIHSVLEPYLAGASVLCGPKVHRSTEYDLVETTSPNLIMSFDKINLLYQQMKKSQCLSNESEMRTVLISESQKRFMDIIKLMDGE